MYVLQIFCVAIRRQGLAIHPAEVWGLLALPPREGRGDLGASWGRIQCAGGWWSLGWLQPPLPQNPGRALLVAHTPGHSEHPQPAGARGRTSAQGLCPQPGLRLDPVPR